MKTTYIHFISDKNWENPNIHLKNLTVSFWKFHYVSQRSPRLHTAQVKQPYTSKESLKAHPWLLCGFFNTIVNTIYLKLKHYAIGFPPYLDVFFYLFYILEYCFLFCCNLLGNLFFYLQSTSSYFVKLISWSYDQATLYNL